MALTAAQITYRREMILGFETRQSYLRDRVTTAAEIEGNTATFLVADSGDATAVTRGVNGRIPGRNDTLAQPAATLQEWHDKVERARFDLFASQGDGRAIMQQTNMDVINRKIDDDILDALSAGTNTLTAATGADLSTILKARTILGNGSVPLNDGNITWIVTPAFVGYLMQQDQFSNGEYVKSKPFESAPMVFRWWGMDFVESANLSGIGTSSAVVYCFHKNAIGHAYDASGMQVVAGYNEEEDYSFSRCSYFMGSKLLQNAGVIKITHDDSGLSS